MAPHTPILILWDIDHTLVSISGVSRETYTRAFEQVIGRQMEHLADMTGRTQDHRRPPHPGHFKPRVEPSTGAAPSTR
ncbi:hypothetical protein [Catenulispora rubra]|uniref:hypothetical protein n=1 Tax=Catenulispora rubra TaxID=280293 RepID=UPI001892256C|nr:hypothetical protein [Catenulispora rubra]